MKKFIKILMVLFLIFVLVIAGIIWWASSYINSDEMRSKIEAYISRQIDGNVKIEKLNFGWNGYFNAENMDIILNNKNRDNFKLKRVSFGVKLLPLISKKIKISTIIVDSPYCNYTLIDTISQKKSEKTNKGKKVVRLNSGNKKVSIKKDKNKLSESKNVDMNKNKISKKGDTEKNSFNIDIKSIKVINGIFHIKDKSSKKIGNIDIEGLNTTIYPENNLRKFTFNFEIAKNSYSQKIKLEGKIELADSKFEGNLSIFKIRSDILAKKYGNIDNIPETDYIFLKFNGNKNNIEVTLDKLSFLNSEFSGKFSTDLRNKESNFSLKSSAIDVTKVWSIGRNFIKKDFPVKIGGNIFLNVNGKFKESGKDLKIDGNLNLNEVEARYNEYPKVKLSGDIDFTKEKLNCKKLNISSSGVSLFIDGEIPVNLANNVKLDLNLKKIELSKLKIPAKIVDMYKIPKIGKIDGNIKVTGKYYSPKINGDINIKNITTYFLNNKKAKLDGKILFKDDLMNIKSIVVKTSPADILISGKIKNLIKKNIIDMNLTIKKLIIQKVLNLAMVEGVKSRGNLKISGNLSGKLPQIKAKLKSEGKNISFNLFSIETMKTYLKIVIDSFNLNSKFEKENFKVNAITKLFGGEINSEFKVKVGKKFPFSFNYNTTKLLDIHKFLKKNPYARAAFRGKFQSSFKIKGKLQSRKSWNGEGKISLKNLLLDGKILFGKLSKYIKNLGNEKFPVSQFSVKIRGTKLIINEINLENRDMKWVGGGEVNLDNLKINLKTKLTIFKAALSGSKYERVISDKGFTIGVPVTGDIFSPNISISTNLDSILGKKLKQNLEGKILKSILGKENSTGEVKLDKKNLKQLLKKKNLKKLFKKKNLRKLFKI